MSATIWTETTSTVEAKNESATQRFSAFIARNIFFWAGTAFFVAVLNTAFIAALLYWVRILE